MLDPRNPSPAPVPTPSAGIERGDVLALPFDQYQRYRLVADLVLELGAGGVPLSLLDVGDREGILRGFLPDGDITLLDRVSSDEPGLVVGDGCCLPFQDDTFDIVCAFDTLEHVPPDVREAFVDECARVSRGWVFLAGPYQTPAVDEAEELLRSFLHEKLGFDHHYLEEHREHGLPIRDDVEERLISHGTVVKSFGHGNLDRWVALMCMEMYLDHDPILRPLAKRFFRFYNEALYASDHAAPVYRHVIAAAHPGCSLPTGRGLLDFPRAPEGSVRNITDFAVELLAFDRDRDVWLPERERLRTVIAGLEKDLEEHRASLSEVRADLDSHRSTLEVLETARAREVAEYAEEKAVLDADLEAHAASLAETKAILEKTLAERAEEKATFEEDLAQHDATIAELRADVAGLKEGLETETELRHDERRGREEERRAREVYESEGRDVEAALREQITEHERDRAELQAHLAETEEGARLLQDELDLTKARAERLAQDVTTRDELIDRLHAAVRRRWANLKRAFGPKQTWE